MKISTRATSRTEKVRDLLGQLLLLTLAERWDHWPRLADRLEALLNETDLCGIDDLLPTGLQQEAISESLCRIVSALEEKRHDAGLELTRIRLEKKALNGYRKAAGFGKKTRKRIGLSC